MKALATRALMVSCRSAISTSRTVFPHGHKFVIGVSRSVVVPSSSWPKSSCSQAQRAARDVTCQNSHGSLRVLTTALAKRPPWRGGVRRSQSAHVPIQVCSPGRLKMSAAGQEDTWVQGEAGRLTEKRASTVTSGRLRARDQWLVPCLPADLTRNLTELSCMRTDKCCCVDDDEGVHQPPHQ